MRNHTDRLTGVLSLLACCVAVLLLTGCEPKAPVETPKPPALPAVSGEPKSFASNLVRGYLAVAVGNTNKAEANGALYDRQLEGKEIYLPGVAVYLESLQGGSVSAPVKTDLSGRFTLQAPAAGEYRLCWKSAVYGDGCLQKSFKAGSEALFLSTVLISLPARPGHAASFGKVRFRDESLPRMLDPLADINAYATVALLDAQNKVLAEVPVNNFGDYFFPYLPTTSPLRLVTRMEGGKGEQRVLPEAFQRNPRLVRYHLYINNTPPRLNAIVPTRTGGNRVQVAIPGETLTLKTAATDQDGDALKVRWLVSHGNGTLSTASGAQTQWTLPTVRGRYAATAIVSDGKGGYAQYSVRLNAGAPGVPFGGVITATDGKLLADAEIEINGKVEKSDASGRFLAYLPEAERYVFNIRKTGYGFYSRVYDRSVAGGRWTLVPATLAEFDPTQPIALQDKRAGRNCPGPDTARVNWNERPELKQVWWQDGKGNNVPAPLAQRDEKVGGAVDGKTQPASLEKLGRSQAVSARQQALLPWQLIAKHGDCGPGMSVKIPANGLQAEDGSAPGSRVVLSLSTVDLLTPEQMPGEDAVARPGGGFGWMQSYGAGSIELHDKASGKRLNLKPGVEAEITLPVDRSSLMIGAPLPAAVPLLYYNEKTGIWSEAHKLTLDASRKNYVTRVKHFSTLNTDVVFSNPSCLRVESSILPPYDLEVIIPLPGGAAPKVKKITITDMPPHVIYSLPNDTNVTLTAIAPGSASVPPRVLGVFVVNTGPQQAAGFSPPPPPTACARSVTLSNQNFPEQPNSGEFLHGLFSFAGTVVNEADIAVSGSLSQQLDQATLNYYAQIDPANERTTLDGFKAKNGFDTAAPPGFKLCGANVCDNPDQEINIAFANSGDLGFGRDMHCRRANTGGGSYDYACYVTNYGDILTNDDQDAENARSNTGVVATVAMEYSRLSAADPVTDRHVKFYVYGADGSRINNADLDSAINIRRRPVPQLCMVCHGGAYPGGGSSGVPSFNTPDSVKLGAKFLPFDARFYTFPASPNKAAQQAAMKRLNEDIVRFAPGGTAITEVIDGMYAGGSATQKEEFVVAGWAQAQLPNTAAQEKFYKRVLGNACRTCHIAQPFANVSNERAGVDLQFRTARDFLRSQTVTSGGNFSPFSSAESRVCQDHVMPHARRTHDIFWGQFWLNGFGAISPTLPGEFQAFGDSIKALPRPAGWPAGEAWPPQWNGKLCNFQASSGGTPPSYYSTFVHPLWTRNYTTRTCSTCHPALSGDASSTHLELLNATGLMGGATPDIVPNNQAGSRLLQKVLSNPAAGTPMPQGCPSPQNRCLKRDDASYNPATDLNPATDTYEINRIKQWINSGALP